MNAVSLATEFKVGAPRRGRSLAALVAPLSRLMLKAVENLSAVELCPDWISATDQVDLEHSDLTVRAPWAIAAAGAVYGFSTSKKVNLADALAWFGDAPSADLLRSQNVSEAENLLTELVGSKDASELFVYVLDAFGPTSRLDVRRDQKLTTNRAARKGVGSFYTPSDVADFMVGAIAGDAPESSAWFDPACGSGVFFLAVLRLLGSRGVASAQVVEFAQTRLWGTDISPLATDFAAFTITQHLAGQLAVTPMAFWSAVRKNLRAIDALSVVARHAAPDDGRCLADLFGKHGHPVKLICNPPYTAARSSAYSVHWASLQGTARANSLYLPFVEMAWKLDGQPGDEAALVVPLSFATTRSADHAHCRTALESALGEWTMLFFDRQPHALFGEDVKTRNAILIRRQRDAISIASSRLLKWTSGQRPEIFTESRAVQLRVTGIRRLIPKLGTPDEAAIYSALTGARIPCTARPQVTSIPPREIAARIADDELCVAGTAYNFLNVFRGYPDESRAGGPFSESRVHRLTFGSRKEANAGFALLSSRVAFWMWHVECDGFHVPAWFLEELPLFDLEFQPNEMLELAGLGEVMWQHAKDDLLASRNGGKLTFAFRPTNATVERDRADAIILAAAGMNDRFCRSLHAFEQAVVNVDGQDRRGRAGAFEKAIRGMIKQ